LSAFKLLNTKIANSKQKKHYNTK